MKSQWKVLLIKLTAWAALEIAFNLVGVDTIADYSEFIFNCTQVIDVYKNDLI
ncbi:hypothetical protein Pse7367_3928 (plasmid) [Thalassoporum mexicanum PCC 7367]|nr:hypothetical protein Pse7367_3928 [Pseudanabaena sp. PCC 7367]